MKRLDGESYDDYRERRTKATKALKKYLKGRVWWDSKNFGTYVRPENRNK